MNEWVSEWNEQLLFSNILCGIKRDWLECWRCVKNASERDIPGWSWEGSRTHLFSVPWNSSKELGWGQKKMGSWVKDHPVVLSSKTLKSMGVFFTESPYLTLIICVCFCELLRFSIIRSLTNSSFCLES